MGAWTRYTGMSVAMATELPASWACTSPQKKKTRWRTRDKRRRHNETQRCRRTKIYLQHTASNIHIGHKQQRPQSKEKGGYVQNNAPQIPPPRPLPPEKNSNRLRTNRQQHKKVCYYARTHAYLLAGNRQLQHAGLLHSFIQMDPRTLLGRSMPWATHMCFCCSGTSQLARTLFLAQSTIHRKCVLLAPTSASK